MDRLRRAGHRVAMSTVVVSGAAGPVAEAVVSALVADADVTQVRVLAPRRWGSAVADPDRVSTAVVDLVGAELAPLLDGADTLVHLGVAGDDLDPTLLAPGRVVAEGVAVLEAAARAGVTQVVVLSSATVYGAWPKNPVPLTEAAVLRPNPDFALAVELAELERLAAEWHDAHASTTLTVLRAVPVVADDHPDWLSRALRSALAFPVVDHDPATQFLHAVDLGSAVVLAARGGLDGVCNVAPDGWLTGGERRALDRRPRVRLGEGVGARVANVRWKLGLAPAPAALLPYVTHAWVVANDRLRAAGWEPTATNEDAYVAGFRAGPWATLSPGRRQELALAGAATGLVGAAVAAGVAVARRRR